jgi:hypothetical protein
MLTPRDLTIQRMTLRHMDAHHRAEIRADVAVRWPATLATIDQLFEDQMRIAKRRLHEILRARIMKRLRSRPRPAYAVFPRGRWDVSAA